MENSILENESNRPQEQRQTEFSNVERLFKRYGEDILHIPELKAWFLWDGTHWRKSFFSDISALAIKTIKAMPQEAASIQEEDARVSFLKFCMNSQKASMVRSMGSLIKNDPRVQGNASELDSDPNLFGVGNGVVDLTNGSFMPASRAHRITITTPVPFDPEAQCPIFCKTLSEVFCEDLDMVAFFQRLIGYSILGTPKESVFVILYGSGSNGKSTIMNTILHVLGDHARMSGANTFANAGAPANDRPAAPREDLLRLRGSRFVYISKPKENARLKESVIKGMTRCAFIPARGRYSPHTVEVKPTWVPFLATNHLPVIKGTDEGIWRRILPIPFRRNFDKDPAITKDRGLAGKLLAEAPGILRWCIEGALKYRAHGLEIPSIIKSEHKDYRSTMDVLED